MDYQSFERLLKLHNTTVYRVAKATGIPNSTFTDWKNGRSCPKADKLRRIADFFDVTLDELLGADTIVIHTGSAASISREEAMRLAGHKLPIKTKFIVKEEA